MKKWLVGLLAAGLCAASAWADGVATLPVNYSLTDKTVAWQSLDGVTQQGLGSIYADGSAKFDTTGDWMAIQFDAVPGALSFKLKGNSASGGEGTLSFKIEESADGETWSPVDTISEIEANQTLEPSYDLASDSRHVRWTYANKVAMNLALNNIAISSGGPAEFSVTFNKENWFKVALGEASSVTAIPKNGVEPYTFLWESDTPELDGGTTDTLEIPATLAEGDYTVACLVTEDNGEGDAINALIGFTVEAIPVISGDVYTLVESADDFEEGADYLIVAYKAETFTSALKNELTGKRIAVEEVVIAEDNTVTTDSDALVWTISAGAEGKYTLYNAAANVYAAAPASESANEAQLLEDGTADAAQWTIDIAEGGLVTIGSVFDGKSLQRNSTAANAYFANYKSGTKPFLFKKAGASGPSVSLVASATEVEVGDEVTVTATAKNFSGDVEWSWTGNGTADGAVFTVDTTEAGAIEVTATATAGEETASKSVTITVNEPAVKYAVNVALGIQNGSVATDVSEAAEGDTVTVTATPAAGYKLGEIIVNNGDVAVNGNTFVMPAQDVLVTATFEEKPPVTGDVLTNEDVGNQASSYVEWTAEKESGAVYAGLTAGGSKDNPCIQLRSTGNAGIVMTESSGSDVASVSIEWNSQTTNSARKVQVYGSATPYSSPADLYGDDKGTLLGEIPLGETYLDVAAVGSFPYIGIRSASSAIYLDSVTVSFCGASGPSVILTPSATEVEVGEEVTITATAKNFNADVEWSWTGKGTADGATFTVDTSAAGVIEVTATATAGEETASKSVTITVNEPAVKYAVVIADGILNGTVTADKEEAEAGETVTLTVEPAEGYKLAGLFYNGTAVSGNSFEMPAEDVLVTASFEEFTAPAVYVTFEEGTYPASYAATEAEVENHGTLAETIPTVKFAVAQTYRGTDANDKKVGDVSIRLRAATSGDAVTNGVFGNAEAFAEPISSLSFQYARYGGDAAPTALKVLVSADGEAWDELADLASTATAELQAYSCDEIPAGSVFFKIEMANSAKSFKRVNIDEIALEFGAPKPSVTCSGETTVQIPGSFSIQFTLKNYDGDYSWAVDSREGGTIDASGLYTWTPAEAGDVTIKVKAVNGETEIASKEVALTVTAPEPPASSIVCNLGTSVEATVGVPVAFEFTAEGVESVDDWAAWWEDGDDVELAYSDDNMSATFEWTPDAVATLTLNVAATVQPNNQQLELTVAVTVSEGGSGDELVIGGFSSSKAGLSFDAPAAGVAVEEATSLKDQDWTPINVAPVDGKIVIPLDGAGKFYRLAK